MPSIGKSSAEKRAASEWPPRFWLGIAFGLLLGALLLAAPAARASLGYELDPSTPSIALDGEGPLGVAVDQSSQSIYVAVPLRSKVAKEFGQVEQLNSSGVATAASPFTISGQPVFSGVAVNPVTHGIYAAEAIVSTAAGNFGTSRVDQFSSTGTLGVQFATGNGPGVAPTIATDTSGRLFYPSAATNAIQLFNSAGALQETISCSGCPGGSFKSPSGVATDSQDNLYVVDFGNDRVIKLTHSGGPYVFASIIQSGRSAVAVAVDPSDDSVLVGDYVDTGSYHIVAYDSSGAQFDDFGAGLFTGAVTDRSAAGQIAANETTHKLYVSDPAANVLRVFSKVTIQLPTATTTAASSVGQASATLNATVNAKSHATIDCHFEYTTDADFQANGYANATDAPCSVLPTGSKNTAVSTSLTGLAPGTAYRFRVVAASNAGSANGSSAAFTTLPETPATVTVSPPSEVTQGGATLAGKVNPHGGAVTDCHFEYGPGTSYSTSTPCKTGVGPVTTEVAQSLDVAGLSAKTSYNYRLSVTSNAGTVVSGGQEFTTLPPAPAVSTDSATGITQTTATIAGTINPNGAAANCHFEYGPTAAYGISGPCVTDPGAGVAAVAETLELTGLTGGTTYHYRLVGANAGGTVPALDRSFTTQAAPPPVALPQPPVVIPPVDTSTPPVVKPLKCKKGFQKKKVRGKLKCVKKKRRRH
jgi:hypothetical protein